MQHVSVNLWIWFRFFDGSGFCPDVQVPKFRHRFQIFRIRESFCFGRSRKNWIGPKLSRKNFVGSLKTSVSVVCDVLWELFFSSFFLMNWSKFANNLFKSVFRRKDKLLFLHFKMVNYSTNLNLSLPWFSYNVAILPRQKYSKWSCFIILRNCE